MATLAISFVRSWRMTVLPMRLWLPSSVDATCSNVSLHACTCSADPSLVTSQRTRSSPIT